MQRLFDASVARLAWRLEPAQRTDSATGYRYWSRLGQGWAPLQVSFLVSSCVVLAQAASGT